MKAFESPGLWYLPDNPGRTISGTLAFPKGNGLELKLTGTLRDSLSFAGAAYPLIHGTLSESPYGRSVSLLGCFSTNLQVGMPGLTLETIHSNHGFIGSFFVESSAELFDSATLSFSDLGAWFARSRLAIEHDADPTAREPVRIVCRPEERVQCIVDGATMSIALDVRTEVLSAPSRMLMREEAFFQIDGFGRATAKEIGSRFYSPLSMLVTFAADDNSPVERFELSTKIDGRPYSVEHLFVSSSPDKKSVNPRSSREMFLTLSDVGDRYQSFMQSWFDFVRRQRDFASLFFSYGYNHQSFVETRFLFLILALRCFIKNQSEHVDQLGEFESVRNRILGDDLLAGQDYSALVFPSAVDLGLPTMLEHLVDDHWNVADRVIGTDAHRFRKAILVTWDFVTHRGEASRRIRDGANLYWLSQRLSTLLKLCILKQLGFPEDRIIGIRDRNAFCTHLATIRDPWNDLDGAESEPLY